jgi:hypothetical protein
MTFRAHKSCEIFAKNFGAYKTSWEFDENGVFGLYLTIRVRICNWFSLENSCSGDINSDDFACPQL